MHDSKKKTGNSLWVKKFSPYSKCDKIVTKWLITILFASKVSYCFKVPQAEFSNRSFERFRSRFEKYCENQCESMGNLTNGSAYQYGSRWISKNFRVSIRGLTSWKMRIMGNLCYNQSRYSIQSRFHQHLKMGIHTSLGLRLIFAIFLKSRTES